MNRAVASLALLKVTWDNASDRRDYIQNFVPFVATLFNKKKYSGVKVGTIRKDFEEMFGLKIPYHPMLVILERARKAGYIERSKNRAFIPVADKVAEIDFSDIVSDQERKAQHLLERFVEYCNVQHNESLTEQEAEKVLLSFVKEHDLDLLFVDGHPQSLLPPASATLSQRYLVHKFVYNAYESDPTIFRFILDFSLGHIFANALVFEEESIGVDHDVLGGCSLYLDSGFLFEITGINEEDRRSAFVEFLAALRRYGGKLFVFRHTYDEFRGIIESSLQWIDNKYYDPTLASKATRFFVENGYTASDVEQFIINVDPTLENNCIEIKDAPDPMVDTIHQEDVIAIKNLIVDIYKNGNDRFDEYDKVYTIDRDVKSISNVYKLRQGSRPTKIEDVTHIFVTENASLALASRKFEKSLQSDRFFSIPAVVTDVFFGTVLWMNLPKDMTRMNERRLIAACYAAFQPNRSLIKKFADTADRLQRSGSITGTDVTLLKQSRVARNLLQDETLGDPERFTDQTALDILHEIRQQIRLEERMVYDAELERNLKISAELQGRLSEYSNEAQMQSQRAAYAESQYEAVRLNVDATSEFIAKWIFRAFLLVASIPVLYSILLGFNPELPPSDAWLKTILFAVAILLAFANAMTGFNVKDAGFRLRRMIQRQIKKIILADRV